jgi:hypothetical protein
MLFGSQRETSGCALTSIVRPMRNAGQVENLRIEIYVTVEGARGAVDNPLRHT